MAALAVTSWNNATDVRAPQNILVGGIALLVQTLHSNGNTANVTLPPMWGIQP